MLPGAQTATAVCQTPSTDTSAITPVGRLSGTCTAKKNQPQSLNAFRTDVEALRTSLPANNVDLSSLFSIDTYPPRYSHLTSHAFLATLRRVNSVSTDRLHVCIAAALLGKEVSFHANKYFKNRAVYETSLAGHFPNVRWADESTDLPLS